MTFPKLVHSPSEVIENIANFEKHAPQLIDRISNARAWYAAKMKGKWKFGHSKFIGYVGLNAKSYIKIAQDLDGRVTEKTLESWFVLLDEDTPIYVDVRVALDEFLGRFGKKPNSLVRISVLKENLGQEFASEKEGLVELLAAMYHRLGPQERADFKKLITQ